MTELTAVIVEDEIHLLDSLALMLRNYCPDVKVIGKAAGFAEGLDCIKHHQPNLVFLDIEMPFGTGFDLLEQLPRRNFDVIFVTAYNQYAVKAIKFSALDYILKPVNIKELIAAVQRVKQKKHSHALANQFQVLFESLDNRMLTKIAIPTSDGMSYLEIADIIHIDAEGRYSRLSLHNQKAILVSRNLGEFDDLLSDNSFCRIHHSHLINLAHVVQYSRRDGGRVCLSNGSTLPLSRSRKEDFLQQIQKISK